VGETIIQRAWRFCPATWPGRNEGHPYYVIGPVVLSVPAAGGDAIAEDHEEQPVEFVHSTREKRPFGPLIWEVTGRYEGKSEVVAWGYL